MRGARNKQVPFHKSSQQLSAWSKIPLAPRPAGHGILLVPCTVSMTLLNSHTTNSSWLLVMAKISLHALSSSSFNVFFKKNIAWLSFFAFVRRRRLQEAPGFFEKTCQDRTSRCENRFMPRTNISESSARRPLWKHWRCCAPSAPPCSKLVIARAPGPIKEPAACQAGRRLQIVSTSRTSEVT